MLICCDKYSVVRDQFLWLALNNQGEQQVAAMLFTMLAAVKDKGRLEAKGVQRHIPKLMVRDDNTFLNAIAQYLLSTSCMQAGLSCG